MREALIGHTGFVGQNLDRQHIFSARYNSENYRSLSGQHFDRIICAGVAAVKWWANQNPREDRLAIQALREVLETVTTDRFVLISTVDVYPVPEGVDELSPVEPNPQPYGRHRREFELFIQDRFPNCLVVRLPGLFGAGLKKNIIFDALSGRPLSGFDSRSQFQFYGLDNVHADVSRAEAAGLALVNFATEPVTAAEIVESVTGRPFESVLPEAPVRYDMRTIYGGLWGLPGGYIRSGRETLARISDFARAWDPR